MYDQVKILIVDSDSNAREALRDVLEVEGFAAVSAAPGSESRLMVRGDVPCIVLLNKMGEPKTGLDYVKLAEHEQYLLGIALEVMNAANGPDEEEAVELAPASLPFMQMIEDRRAFQLSVARRNGSRPVAASMQLAG